MHRLKEKIEKLLLSFVAEDTPPFRCLPAINKTVANIKAARIVSELQQTIEDAEKWQKVKKVWNEECQYDGDSVEVVPKCEEWKEKASQWDKMFERLIVEKKCSICGDWIERRCNNCNGTGTVSRPLTEEEKMFLVSQIVGETQGGRDIMLPSGKKVVRKK